MSTQPGGNADHMKFENATAQELVAIWLGALESLADVADSLTAAAWATDSPCPGWTAGDVVAHVLSLESELHGEAVPEHEPDWAALPHVTSPFGRYTEVPVDWYRSKGRDVVLAELREIIAWRAQDLADVPDDLTETVTGPAGWQTSRNQMFRTRILDTWMHEQDVRAAANQPGGQGSDAAWVTAGQFLSGLPFVWGKSTGAPVGSSLHLTLTGPGIELERTVRVDDDKRARFVDGSVHEATLRMTVSWPLYAALSGGRVGAIAQAQRGHVEFHGDVQLSQSLLPALATTP
ncbi:MAG: maleylpyruvate isomerase N-terminal domain-containing protein [Candidatus Nanopelagicales bacterium]